MPSYLDRFRELEREISAHPYFEVLQAEYPAGLTDEQLIQVEERTGARLPDSIRDFYALANGLRLEWGIKNDLTEAARKDVIAGMQGYSVLVGESNDAFISPIGSVHILRIEHCFIDGYRIDYFPDPDVLDDSYRRHFDFAGRRLYTDRDFFSVLRPFDLFSDYYCMAFVMEKGEVNDFEVMLLSDYYIEFDHSRISDFNTYLEIVLATKAITYSRRKIYGTYRGDKMSPLVLEEVNMADVVPDVFQ